MGYASNMLEQIEGNLKFSWNLMEIPWLIKHIEIYADFSCSADIWLNLICKNNKYYANKDKNKVNKI